MSDLASRENLYFTIQEYNSTSQPVRAQQLTNLLVPIIPNVSDYNVGISKARVDLSSIPLTTHNIPLKTYQVGIRSGTNEYTEYVRQENSSNTNYLYNITSTFDFERYKYNATTGVATLSPLPQVIPVGTYFGTVFQFVVTDYENIFIVGSAIPNSLNYELVIGFDKNGNVFYNSTFASVQAICLDRVSNLYLALEQGTGSQIQIYALNETTNPVTLTPVNTITQDANNDPLSAIKTICADGSLIVGSEQNKITIYAANLDPITTYNEGSITQLGTSSAIIENVSRFCLVDQGGPLDSFIGLKTGGAQTLTDYYSDAQFVGGTWDIGKKSPMIASATNISVGYGLGGGQLYSYTFNTTTGLTGSPSLANSDILNNLGQGTQRGLLYGVKSPLSLSGWDIDPNSANQWSQIDSNFNVGGSLPLCQDAQQSSHKILALDSTNALNITNYPVLTRCQVGLFDLANPSDVGFVQQTNGGIIDNASIPNCLSLFQQSATATFGTALIQPVSIISAGNYYFILFINSTFITLDCAQINKNDFSVVTFWSTIVTSTQISNASGFGLCQVDNTHIAISDSNNNVYIYTYGGTLDSTITLPNVGTGYASFQLSRAQFGLGNVLAISSNTNLYFYDITNPIAPLLISNLTFTPSGYPAQYISGLQLQNDAGTPVVWFSTNGSDPVSTPGPIISAVWSEVLTFPNFTFATTPTAPKFSSSNPLAYGPNNLSLNTNIYGTEIALKEGYASVFQKCSGTVEYFNNTSNSIWFKSKSVNPSSVIQPDICLLDDMQSTYSWVSISYTGIAGTIVSFALSQTNQNLVYALDGSGNMFVGDLIGNAIAFVPYTPTPASTYETINSFPSSIASYTSYVNNFSLSNQTAEGSYNFGSNQVKSVARNAISDEFLVSSGNNVLQSFNPADFSQNWLNSTLGAQSIYAKNAVDVNAGDYPIYDFQTLINAINEAFLGAYLKAPTGTFNEPPSVSFNFSTGLATLNYSSDYYSVDKTKGILMNSAMHNLLYFYSTVDTLNSSLYLVSISPNSTSLTQTSKSLYAFNELAKIIFISNVIYVFGSFIGQNNTNNIIGDLDVLTNSDGYSNNLGEVVYFQPQFIRPYVMSSNKPLNQIQLEVWYETLKGEQFPLYLNPNAEWDVKLIFMKKY